MSNWKSKGCGGFLIILFLVTFGPCTAKTNISARSAYGDKINSCYALLEDQVLYKDNQRSLYLRSLLDPQKLNDRTYKGRLFYTTIPDKLKKNPSLIKESFLEKAVAVIPKGTVIKVKQVFRLESAALRGSIQLVGHIELPQFRGINIQLNDLFEVYTPECEPKLDVIKPVTCASINVSGEK